MTWWPPATSASMSSSGHRIACPPAPITSRIVGSAGSPKSSVQMSTSSAATSRSATRYPHHSTSSDRALHTPRRHEQAPTSHRAATISSPIPGSSGRSAGSSEPGETLQRVEPERGTEGDGAGRQQEAEDVPERVVRPTLLPGVPRPRPDDRHLETVQRAERLARALEVAILLARGDLAVGGHAGVADLLGDG